MAPEIIRGHEVLLSEGEVYVDRCDYFGACRQKKICTEDSNIPQSKTCRLGRFLI
jgi:hypothetical protein